MSRAVSVTTKMVKQAKAVTKVVQTPITAAFVFSGTALFNHATVHIDSDNPAWTCLASTTSEKGDCVAVRL